MSEELVNQLTLNFLISKNQLQKLNKKIKENTETNRKTDKEIYGERIQKLFSDLLVYQQPEDLLEDVKTGFDFFIDKTLYYLKAKDNNELLEKERCEPDIIHDDIDFDKEERDIANGNYVEEGYEEDYEEKEDESIILDSNFDNKIEYNSPISVRPRHTKIKNSVGVDDIQKLRLNWFQNVRQNYKKNNIIPRREDNII